MITSLALYCVEPSGFRVVLKSHFDPIGLSPKSFRSSCKLTGEKVSFRMIELFSSMIAACHCFVSGLSIASSYEIRSPSVVVEASALCISSETFTCALLLLTLSVSTGAMFDLLVVAATDRRNCLRVMTSSLDGA